HASYRAGVSSQLLRYLCGACVLPDQPRQQTLFCLGPDLWLCFQHCRFITANVGEVVRPDRAHLIKSLAIGKMAAVEICRALLADARNFPSDDATQAPLPRQYPRRLAEDRARFASLFWL